MLRYSRVLLIACARMAVKPPNILLDESNHAVLADIGIAKAAKRAVTPPARRMRSQRHHEQRGVHYKCGVHRTSGRTGMGPTTSRRVEEDHGPPNLTVGGYTFLISDISHIHVDDATLKLGELAT